jgi:hypothetical protein
MTATVSIRMEVTINKRVYTVNGTVDVDDDYFDGWSRMQWPISTRAAELAEILQSKVEEKDYSFLA